MIRNKKCIARLVKGQERLSRWLNTCKSEGDTNRVFFGLLHAVDDMNLALKGFEVEFNEEENK